MKVMGTPTKKEVLSMNPNYDITSFEDIPIISKKSWEDVKIYINKVIRNK